MVLLSAGIFTLLALYHRKLALLLLESLKPDLLKILGEMLTERDLLFFP
jgi:hypothetical protein